MKVGLQPQACGFKTPAVEKYDVFRSGEGQTPFSFEVIHWTSYELELGFYFSVFHYPIVESELLKNKQNQLFADLYYCHRIKTSKFM